MMKSKIVATITTDMMILFLSNTAAHPKMTPIIPLLSTIIPRTVLLTAMYHPTMVAWISLPMTTPPSPPKITLTSPVTWSIRPISGYKCYITVLSSILSESRLAEVPVSWSISPLICCKHAIDALSSIISTSSLVAVSKKSSSFFKIYVRLLPALLVNQSVIMSVGTSFFVCSSPQNITDVKYQKIEKCEKILILINVWKNGETPFYLKNITL